MEKKNLYTIGQSAKILGVSKSTIRAWIHEGKLQSSLDAHGIHHIPNEGLDAIKTYFTISKRTLKKPENTSHSIKIPQYPLALDKASKFLRISKNTLLRWEQAGIIVSTRTPGGARRYYPHDLATLLAHRTPYQRLPRPNPSVFIAQSNKPILTTEVIEKQMLKKTATHTEPQKIETQRKEPLRPETRAVVAALFRSANSEPASPRLTDMQQELIDIPEPPLPKSVINDSPHWDLNETGQRLTIRGLPSLPIRSLIQTPLAVLRSKIYPLRSAICDLPSAPHSPLFPLGLALLLLFLGSGAIFTQIHVIGQKEHASLRQRIIPTGSILGMETETNKPTPIPPQTTPELSEKQELTPTPMDDESDTISETSASDSFPFEPLIETIEELATTVVNQQSTLQSQKLSFTSMFGIFASAVIDTLKTTILSAGTISTDTLAIGGTNISEYVVNTINTAFEDNKISFHITNGSIEHLKTDTLSPLSSDNIDLLLTDANNNNLSSNSIISPLPAIRVKNDEGTVVTAMDVEGNISTLGTISSAATISAQSVIASSVVIPSEVEGSPDQVLLDVDGSATIAGNLTVSGDSTVSGTLVANTIKTSFGDLNNTLSSLQSSVSSLSSDLSLLSSSQSQATQPSLSSDFVSPSPDLLISPLSASASALIASIFDTTPETPVDVNLSGKQITINALKTLGNITAFGGATLGETMIAGSLLVDATIKMDVDGIQSLGGPIMFQKSGLYGIDMMDGLLVLNEQGDVTIRNNLFVDGAIKTNTLSPLAGDLAINLVNIQSESTDSGNLPAPDSGNLSLDSQNQGTTSFGKLLIKGADGKTVVSFDEDGHASMSGNLTAKDLKTEKLTLVRANTQEETEVSSSSVGQSTLLSGNASIVIQSSQVTKNSLVFITPTTYTDRTLSVTDTSDNAFTVSISSPTSIPVSFNWWVIN